MSAKYPEKNFLQKLYVTIFMKPTNFRSSSRSTARAGTSSVYSSLRSRAPLQNISPRTDQQKIVSSQEYKNKLSSIKEDDTENDAMNDDIQKVENVKCMSPPLNCLEEKEDDIENMIISCDTGNENMRASATFREAVTISLLLAEDVLPPRLPSMRQSQRRRSMIDRFPINLNIGNGSNDDDDDNPNSVLSDEKIDEKIVQFKEVTSHMGEKVGGFSSEKSFEEGVSVKDNPTVEANVRSKQKMKRRSSCPDFVACEQLY